MNIIHSGIRQLSWPGSYQAKESDPWHVTVIAQDGDDFFRITGRKATEAEATRLQKKFEKLVQ